MTGLVNKILYTKDTKYPTGYTGDTKYPTMYSGESGPPTPPPVTTDKLLMESGFYLLLETGGKIVLD